MLDGNYMYFIFSCIKLHVSRKKINSTLNYLYNVHYLQLVCTFLYSHFDLYKRNFKNSVQSFIFSKYFHTYYVIDVPLQG